MTRYAEPDEYQVGTLVNGLPTCTFHPKPYHRVITTIVVTNSATSAVNCYRGVLQGSLPVAQNLLGSSNTLRGQIKIPAGQGFFVQWTVAGASVRDATARVSWERDDNPLEVGGSFGDGGQVWDTEAITSLQVPTAAGIDSAAIIIGADLPLCMQTDYSSAIMWRPNGSVTSNRLYYFIAQPRLVLTQEVDHGLLWYNGSDCGFVVMQRIEGFFFGPNLIFPQTTYGKVYASPSVAFSAQPDFDYIDANVTYDTNTLVELLNTARFEAYGDMLTLRNDCDNGAANANTSTNSAAFSNYPTAVTCSLDKVGGALETCFQIEYAQTYYVDNTNTGPLFGVNTNGPSGSTDHITHKVPGTLAATFARMSSVGMVKTVGLLAGTYTFTPRWARISGAGSVYAASGDDWTSLKVAEVPI